MQTEQEKIPARPVDTQIFLGAVKAMVRDGHDIAVTITGNSMSPFLIQDGIRSCFTKYRSLCRKAIWCCIKELTVSM